MIFPIMHILLSAIAFGFAAVIFAFAWRRRPTPGSVSLVAFAVDLAVWALAEALTRTGIAFLRPLWPALAILAATLAVTTLLTFSLEYTDRQAWLPWWGLVMLGIEPLASQVLLWTGWGGLFRVGASLYSGGAWAWFNLFYAIVLLLVPLTLLTDMIAHSPRPYHRQAGVILAGGLVPLLVDVLALVRPDLVPAMDLNLLAFTLASLALAFGLIQFHLLDIVPISRSVVVERMSDGWMVLDNRNRVVDLNPAVESLLGIPREDIFGQPVESILSDWPNLMKRPGDARELDIRGTVNTPSGWRFLNLRLSPLEDGLGHSIGQVIVWRDNTERRKVDEARQHARDEMFVLLHAISGAASRALNLDDFLSEAIYQIVYSFQSQSSVIFLLDEDEDNPDQKRLSLAAHHGLPMWGVDPMASVPEAYEMVSWVLKHREPLIIPDISTDPRIPWSMQQAGHVSLLIAPMAIEDQLQGVIGLARRNGPVFTGDEISRLGAVAEEVATFISSNRQRQVAMAISERQRLVRDLHDSVTQKLYGLVTLTEAAQAGLEAGSAEMSAKVLERIGENARQALKEMRLFLHELQPVDIKREGLVAVLHQRLAAVEGRADVKARLLADDNVTLPLDKEVALYYIAQEALNNVLRHANAKSVTVRIRKKKAGVLLEVQDDGSGFDPRQADRTGMGLRNMQERADQAGGKLEITSAPGKGTKVSVTVEKGQSKNHTRERST